jgi:hypothetical protein
MPRSQKIHKFALPPYHFVISCNHNPLHAYAYRPVELRARYKQDTTELCSAIYVSQLKVYVSRFCMSGRTQRANLDVPEKGSE